MQRVLIVDDDKTLRRIYKKILAVQGFEVVEAANGEEATIELLRNNSFDLILLDIRMPVVNGTVCFDTIRLYNPSAKIVISSVYPVEDQRQLIDGADDYFDKSSGTPALISKIKNLLQVENIR